MRESLIERMAKTITWEFRFALADTELFLGSLSNKIPFSSIDWIAENAPVGGAYVPTYARTLNRKIFHAAESILESKKVSTEDAVHLNNIFAKAGSNGIAISVSYAKYNRAQLGKLTS